MMQATEKMRRLAVGNRTYWMGPAAQKASGRDTPIWLVRAWSLHTQRAAGCPMTPAVPRIRTRDL